MSAAPARPALRIALLPLDERPACTRLPAQIAAVAGADVLRPPLTIMPQLREPGDADALGAWLVKAARDADVAVVSLETLGHGGLIASRTEASTVAEVTARWQILSTIAAAGTPVHAVTLVTRTPDSDDAMEEPEYWNPHGPALHRLSAELHRGEQPQARRAEQLTAAREAIPPAIRSDFARRRLRNHALNLTALELAAGGVLDSLVVGADDTAPWAVATAELQQLQLWCTRLECDDRVSVRPGADEATATLVARTLLSLLDSSPITVTIEAVDPYKLARIAPYENIPVGQTAAGQVEACGATVHSGTNPDLYLLVHTPDGDGDWAAGSMAERSPTSAQAAHALAERAVALLDAGHRVAVADCAQPNGADPLLADALLRSGVAHRLTAYAGWNTAGDTLGTAVAHAVTAVAALRAGRFDESAHLDLLAHRFTEDRGYMSLIRPEIRTALGSVPGRHDHVPDGHPLLDRLAEDLTRYAEDLPGFKARIAPGSVRLPWQRTFEVDFDVSTGLTPATTTAEENR
ncbi:DUF4127 family protein [Streptomyces sp. NPDC005386]|uniref:DUF4127 family protein n=1 Tax=Streptomyces sp. NPDC005386 TaxID=3154562 RepID=UPI0033AC4344